MRQIKALLLVLTLGFVTNLARCDEPSTVPLKTLTTEQAKFLKSLEGTWIPKEVLIGGKPFNGKVAIRSVLVNRSIFEVLGPNDSKTQLKCTRISIDDKKIDLVMTIDEKPFRYLMKLDGKTMRLATNASDKNDKEWTTEPTDYNLCILLERKDK